MLPQVFYFQFHPSLPKDPNRKLQAIVNNYYNLLHTASQEMATTLLENPHPQNLKKDDQPCSRKPTTTKTVKDIHLCSIKPTTTKPLKDVLENPKP
jgi:hypothetical protein